MDAHRSPMRVLIVDDREVVRVDARHLLALRSRLLRRAIACVEEGS